MIVGGGIVGLATAMALRSRFPQAAITLVEKEAGVAQHQSTHNSGVLHCGLYYKPGSLKAKLAVEGIQLMTDFCRQHAISHEICGKLVVAVDPSEVARLEELLRRGEANGLQGLRRLDGSQMRQIEPHVAGVAAVHVPQEGIVDYRHVCDTLAELIQASGTRLLTRHQVLAMHRRGDEWVVECNGGVIQGEFLINCGGLHCDRVAAMAKALSPLRIVPFRGEYHRLTAEAVPLCRHLIYPVPDPGFPFLGVHFTRLIHGGVEAGPNAVLAFSREGYRMSTIDGRDLWEALSFPGLWRFLAKHRAMATAEIGLSLSRRRFCRALQRLVPEIQLPHLAPGGAGVRAQAMTPQGDLVQDFHTVRGDHALHLLNAPSPAATASLAIGRHLASMI